VLCITPPHGPRADLRPQSVTNLTGSDGTSGDAASTSAAYSSFNGNGAAALLPAGVLATLALGALGMLAGAAAVGH
jgi:hypothetical protein